MARLLRLNRTAAAACGQPIAPALGNFASSDPRVDPRELADFVVVANYLRFAGREDKIEPVTLSLITKSDFAKFVKIRPVPKRD